MFRIRQATPAINQGEDTTKLFRDLCEAVLRQCKGSKILCDYTSAWELDRGTILMWRASFPSAIKNRNSMILVIRFNDPGRFKLSVWQVLLDFFVVVLLQNRWKEMNPTTVIKYKSPSSGHCAFLARKEQNRRNHHRLFTIVLRKCRLLLISRYHDLSQCEQPCFWTCDGSVYRTAAKCKWTARGVSGHDAL